jgi:5-methylcytosine-specific restriction endonuclease McrA
VGSDDVIKRLISHGDNKRRRLAERDGAQCWLCKGPFELKGPLKATIDHIIPRSLGGTDRMDNLKLAHRLCNRKRGSEDPNSPSTRRRIAKALEEHISKSKKVGSPDDTVHQEGEWRYRIQTAHPEGSEQD